MKPLCITGAPSPGLADIAEALYYAGLAPAKKLQREAVVDFHHWHQHAVPLLRSQNSAGRLWQQLAEELLLANVSEGAWGWHDEESVWALDFWAEMEPRIHFLLLCESAESYLAKEILKDSRAFEPEAVIREWQQRHSHMLEFYLKYPERCVMVDTEDAALAPSSLINVLNERWQLLGGAAKPHRNEDLMFEMTPPLQLATIIARGWVAKSGEQLEYLRQELAAAQYPLMSADRSKADTMPAAQEKVDYSQIAQYLQTFNRLQRQEAQINQQEQQGTLPVSAGRISHADQEVERLNRECEELLITVHRTQEDLERNIERASQAEQEVERLGREYGELSLRTQRAEETLERYAERASQAEQEVERLNREYGDLSLRTQRAEETLEHYSERALHAEQEVERLNRECEELLITVHRTQEDLEQYAERYSGQNTVNQELKQRLAALKRRINPLAAAEHTEAKYIEFGRVEWSFKHVLVGDREYPRLTVLANLGGGTLSLEVRTEDTESWSIDANHPAGLSLLLPQQRELANALPELIRAHLTQACDSRREIRQWQRGIEKLQQKLAEQPPQLTFEAPELHHVQVNPDYEHLWLTLRRASFAGSEPVDWQFRVSCANVTPREFGSQPKLEFPRQTHQLLKGWFRESQDNFGEKLELRFALPDAMDGGIWKRLQKHDRELIQSLLQQLPLILGILEQQGRHLGREWHEWGKLVDDMRRILKARVM